MSTASIKKELEKYGLTPNRALGQNFLASEEAAELIAAAACESGLPVIEIGPGMGALTEQLVRLSPKTAAIELDGRMADIIAQKLPEVELIRGDALKADIPGIIASLGGRASIAANLPYYITTPICLRLISTGADGSIPTMTLMMQREAAERFTASPKDRVYGPLSILAGYYYSVERLMELSRDMYYPQPEVDSTVLKLTHTGAKRLERLERLTNAAFMMRRKTLWNNLRAAGIPAERLKELLERLEIPAGIRAEELSIQDFANIAREI